MRSRLAGGCHYASHGGGCLDGVNMSAQFLNNLYLIGQISLYCRVLEMYIFTHQKTIKTYNAFFPALYCLIEIALLKRFFDGCWIFSTNDKLVPTQSNIICKLLYIRLLY